MDVGVYPYPQGDPLLIDKIVNEFLSQGKFDKLRKECMSDADTKPAYQNLQQRVENTVSQFLKKQVWRPDLNKNQLRDSLRKHILESKFFDAGINRIVDQVVNPNLLATVFLPEVEEVVYSYLSIPRPADRNQKKGSSDEKLRPSEREFNYNASQPHERSEKNGVKRSDGVGDQRRENHLMDEDYKPKDLINKKLSKDIELSNEPLKTEPDDRLDDKIKSEPPERTTESQLPVEKMETPSDESQESLNRMTVEGLRISEPEFAPAAPDSDDSVPLEINEKSMSESRDSEDSIMNQMSPISQGRLTPELEEKPEEKPEEKSEEKPEEKKEEEKKPLTFIGRIPKIKREDPEPSKPKEDVSRKEKLDVKVVYSSDESDSSKSYGKSDSDEKRRKSEKASKAERRRDDSEKDKDRSSRDRKREKSKDRHKDRGRDRSRDRHKKSSSSSSSSQRERSSSHRKSSHHHKDSRSRRKEDEKKKSKSTDDHGKEKIKKEYRRSTDRDSNERERERSSGSRSQGDSRKREKEQQQKTEEGKGESSQKEGQEMEQQEVTAREVKDETGHDGGAVPSQTAAANDSLDYSELFRSGALTRIEFPKLTDDFYVKFNSTGFRYFEEWEKTKLDCEEEFKEFVDEAGNDLSLLSDDDSDPEFESRFAEENKRTIRNLLRGVGNFPLSLMLDPVTYEFYRWRRSQVFEKFRARPERWRRRTEKESEESIKENIDRGEKARALHLKLLNKYKRKAMRMGRSRRRQRRPGCWGIKEQNENRGVYKKKLFKTFFGSKLQGGEESVVVESVNESAEGESVKSVNRYGDGGGVTLPESPEENEDWGGSGKGESGGEREREAGSLGKAIPLHLPPSPDSDDINNGITPKPIAVFRKRTNKEIEEEEAAAARIPKKQKRRNYSQKYDSQDLYKPRPILNSSRTRGKERGGLERDAAAIDSPISR